MLPPSIAVDTGAAGVGVTAAVAGAAVTGAAVAGAAVGVLVLLEHAVATSAAIASKDPRRFISTPFVLPSGTGSNRAFGRNGFHKHGFANSARMANANRAWHHRTTDRPSAHSGYADRLIRAGALSPARPRPFR
jgi:hypothetical protein